MTPEAVLVLGLVAILAGFGKTGLPASGALLVPLAVLALPPRPALAVLAPLLLLADLAVVRRPRLHADRRLVLRMAAPAAAGLCAAVAVLAFVGDALLRPLIGGLILALLAVEAVARVRPEASLARRRFSPAAFGGLAGFAATVANAGSLVSTFLLGRGLAKEAFVGTAAWFFVLVNAAKLAAFAGLGMVDGSTLALGAALAPGVLIGLLLGTLALRRISQQWFTRTTFSLAAVGALPMLVGI
jgi:hypothetical protein